MYKLVGKRGEAWSGPPLIGGDGIEVILNVFIPNSRTWKTCPSVCLACFQFRVPLELLRNFDIMYIVVYVVGTHQESIFKLK